MILAEAHVQTLGFLGGPGVVALGAGAVLAVAGLGGGAALAVVAALVLVTAGVGMLTLTLRKGLMVRSRLVRAGRGERARRGEDIVPVAEVLDKLPPDEPAPARDEGPHALTPIRPCGWRCRRRQHWRGRIDASDTPPG